MPLYKATLPQGTVRFVDDAEAKRLSSMSPQDLQSYEGTINGSYKEMKSLSALPLALRQAISQYAAKPDEEMGDFIRKQGYFFVNPSVALSAGRFLQDEKGNRYDLDESMPGQSLLREGPAFGLQLGGMALGGPAAGAVKILAGDVGGSVAGDAYKAALNKMLGIPVTTSAGDVATNAAEALGSDVLFRGLGTVGNVLTGKGRAIRAGAEAEGAAIERMGERATKALGFVEKGQANAATKVVNAEQRWDLLKQSYLDKGLSQIREETATSLVGKEIPLIPALPEKLTIESLTERHAPLRQATSDATGEIFKGIGRQMEDVLKPHAQNRVTLDLDYFKEDADKLFAGGSAFSRLFGEAKEMFRKRPIEHSQEALLEMIRGGGLGKGLRLQAEAGLSGEITVAEATKLQQDLGKIVRSTRDAQAQRFAMNMSDAVGQSIEQAVPAEAMETYRKLQGHWREASNLFAGVQGDIARTSRVHEVADVLLDTLHGPKAQWERARLVVQQMEQQAPENLPLLRASFAERFLKSDDIVKDVEQLDPAFFRRLYKDTPFQDPKAWVSAIKGQITLADAMKNPAMMQKLNDAVREGANSIGGKKAMLAIDQAKKSLAKVADPKAYVDRIVSLDMLPGEAKEAAIRDSLIEPIGGNYVSRALEHRLMISMMVGVGAEGARYFGLPHAELLWLPATWVAGSMMWGWAMKKPKVANMMYHAVTSPTVEKAGWLAGRAMATSLAESVKE